MDGSISIDLRLKTDKFEKELMDAKKKAQKAGSEIAESLNPDSSASEIEQVAQGLSEEIAEYEDITNSIAEERMRLESELAKLTKQRDSDLTMSREDTKQVEARIARVTELIRQNDEDAQKNKQTLKDLNDVYFKLIKLSAKRAEMEKKQNEEIDYSRKTKQIGQFAKKMALSLLGLQSAFSVINKGFNAFMQNNEEWSKQLQGVWNALGELMAPAIEWLLSLLLKGVAYINAFVKALTGIDFVARANTKSLAKQNKELKQASFDEQNTLGSSSSATTLNLPDIGEASEKVTELGQRVKKVWETIIKPVFDFCIKHWDLILPAITLTIMAIYAILNPIGAVKLAVVALIAMILLYWEDIKEFFTNLGNKIREIWTSITDWIKEKWGAITKMFTWENIKTAVTGMWDNMKTKASEALEAIKSSFKSGVNGIIEWVEKAINKVVSGVNSLINKFNNSGIVGALNTAMGWNIHINTIGDVKLGRLARGGTAFRPTPAIFGEAGKEVAIPLEKDTGWADILADKINGKGDQTIIIKMDGRTISKEIRKADKKLAYLTNGG